MQAFGRNQTSASADQGGVVSDESATGNGLIPSTAPMISSLLRGRRNPSKPAGALHLWGYCSGATPLTLWLFGAGSWHRGSGCGSEETTPPWSASRTSPHPAKKSQAKILIWARVPQRRNTQIPRIRIEDSSKNRIHPR
jgi:hypothetical protein